MLKGDGWISITFKLYVVLYCLVSLLSYKITRRKTWKANYEDDDEEEESFCSAAADKEDGVQKQIMIQSSRSRQNNEEDQDDGSKVFAEKPKSQPRSFCFGLQTIHAPWFLYFLVALVVSSCVC